MKLKSNPYRCINLDQLSKYDGNCVRCYHSMVTDGVFTGPRKCYYESQCLRSDLTDSQAWGFGGAKPSIEKAMILADIWAGK